MADALSEKRMHTSAQAAPGATSSAPAPESPPMSLHALIDDYMGEYAGRDRTRPTTLAFWREIIGDIVGARPFLTITEDDLFRGLEQLRARDARVYAGKDADGRP